MELQLMDHPAVKSAQWGNEEALMRDKIDG